MTDETTHTLENPDDLDDERRRRLGLDRPCFSCTGEMREYQRQQQPHGIVYSHCEHHNVAVIAQFDHGVLATKRAYAGVAAADFAEVHAGWVRALDGGSTEPI